MKLKKGVSLFLTGAMVLGLLAGCGQKNIAPTSNTIIDRDTKLVVSNKENPKINYEVIKYSKDDKIIQLLEEQGFDMKNGYSLYPNNFYFYPEYLKTENGLQVVYLSRKSLLDGDEFKREDMYLSQDLVSMPSSTKGDMYAAYKYGKYDNGLMNAISGFVNSGSSALSDIMSSESVSDSFIEPDENLNTSEYKDVKESAYLNVSTSPLSTFAADVDTASYTNYRNILRSKLWYIDSDYDYGNMIIDDLHDIRVEEILNYFNYDFSNGQEYINDKFAITAEIGNTPWNNDSKLLVVNVKAKELPIEERVGSNLVFLIDTSGSMDSYEKMGLLVESLKLLVEELNENDTVSIVTYASNDRVVLEGVKGSEKEKIIDALDELIAEGSTNGEGGIKKAYKIAKKYMNGHSNSRVIMCSDGDLNVGISSEDALIKLIEKERESGIYLSVLGFGTGNYKDNKMEALADNGNGNYYYIDSLKEGYKVLVEDLTSTLITIADDVKFQLEFNPEYIKGYRKIGYENRNMANEDFHDDTKDGGEVGYGHEVTVVYELIMVDSAMELGDTNLKYQDNVSTGSTDWLTVSIRYKDHGEKESNLIEYIVDEDNYLDENSADWRFVSDVVGFSLVANDSKYVKDLDIFDIIADLERLNLVDEDKQEFLALTFGYALYLGETITSEFDLDSDGNIDDDDFNTDDENKELDELDEKESDLDEEYDEEVEDEVEDEEYDDETEDLDNGGIGSADSSCSNSGSMGNREP